MRTVTFKYLAETGGGLSTVPFLRRRDGAADTSAASYIDDAKAQLPSNVLCCFEKAFSCVLVWWSVFCCGVFVDQCSDLECSQCADRVRSAFRPYWNIC